MQIVIDIDENLLEGIKSDDFDFARRVVKNFQGTIASAIANDTVLPKHGDLVDRSEIEVEEDVYNQTYIIHAPTILEANK